MHREQPLIDFQTAPAPSGIFNHQKANMPHIIPTVGRKVYFFANDTQEEPHDATIIKVHAKKEHATPTTAVNLLVINPDTGEVSLHTSVVAHDEPQPFQHYRWMDYQKQQAKKSA